MYTHAYLWEFNTTVRALDSSLTILWLSGTSVQSETPTRSYMHAYTAKDRDDAKARK